jgi:hypothetical protein
MKVALADRTVLYVSGTASIDTQGRVVHEGEIEGQLHRMFLGEGEVWAATEHGLARGILSAGPEGFAPPGLSQESGPAARTRAGGQ